MTAVHLCDPPPVVADWLAERSRLGLDLRDEVWEGVLHVAPYATGAHSYLESKLGVIMDRLAVAAGLFASGPCNVGEPADYRVPDRAVHRQKPALTWFPSVAVAAEILSPSDETFQKFGFYADHDVDELWVVDGSEHSVRIWQLRQGEHVETGRSDLLATSGIEVAAELDWP